MQRLIDIEEELKEQIDYVELLGELNFSSSRVEEFGRMFTFLCQKQRAIRRNVSCESRQGW